MQRAEGGLHALGKQMPARAGFHHLNTAKTVSSQKPKPAFFRGLLTVDYGLKTVSSKKPKPAFFTLTEKIRNLAVTRTLVPASYHT